MCWFPTVCWPETNRLSDISSAKMGLFRISRAWQFEVCICAEPSLSPQSARAGEHFYRGEEEVGRALTESKAFHCLCPCQERRGVSLLPVGGCCCCNLICQSYQRLSTGDHMGLLEHSVVVMTAVVMSGGTLSCSEHHWPSQHPREVFSPGLLPTFPRPILRVFVAGSRSYNQEVAKSRL